MTSVNKSILFIIQVTAALDPLTSVTVLQPHSAHTSPIMTNHDNTYIDGEVKR